MQIPPDRVRDWSCGTTYTQCTGLPACTEQHVPQWDLVDPDTGEAEEARLDIATSDVGTGAPLFYDVVVKCAFSADPAVLRRRARRNGLAASDGVAAKRRRYASAGAALVPLAFEAGASDEAASFVRLCGSMYTQTHKDEDGTLPPCPQAGCGRSSAPCFSWAMLRLASAPLGVDPPARCFAVSLVGPLPAVLAA